MKKNKLLSLGASRMKKNKLLYAGELYLRAKCAHRDAVLLLDVGLAEVTEEARKTLTAEPRTLQQAMRLCAITDALEALRWYPTDPDGCPHGRTAREAMDHAMENVRNRYQNGKCTICGGKALPCARRHAHNRSCA